MTEEKEVTDVQLDRSSKRIVPLQLKDSFFTEEYKECIAPRDSLWVHEGDTLKEYMTFAGLTVSQHRSGSLGDLKISVSLSGRTVLKKHLKQVDI